MVYEIFKDRPRIMDGQGQLLRTHSGKPRVQNLEDTWKCFEEGMLGLNISRSGFQSMGWDVIK